jgi:2-hydroxy-3-oxopropionate reductase
VDELTAEGAVAADSPKEVAAQVDVVFTNLPDTPDVEKVVLGEKGIIEGAHEGWSSWTTPPSSPPRRA